MQQSSPQLLLVLVVAAVTPTHPVLHIPCFPPCQYRSRADDHSLHNQIDRSHELIALNGSVVALCTSRGQRGLPPHRWKYVGLGIVRAVSTRQRLYFIATPVGRDVLVSQNVDAAISSRFVQMPAQSMSTYASTDSTELPYTTSDAVALMSVSMQGRGNLKRSRLSERNYSRRTAGPRG
mmetsp:Transcript_2655/g.7998  ORF Transcript_2655/g.7998 Transcript_2655/m.7998 type:complete len:179 (-) Transcript_2655:840-1376(-)